MGLHKIFKYVLIALGVVGMGMLGYILATGDDSIKADAAVQAKTVTPFIWLSIVTLGIGVLIVLAFVLKGIFSNPGALKKTLISVGIFLVIVAIGYFLSKGDLLNYDQEGELTKNGSKWVGAGLRTFYVLAVLAIGSMVAAGVKNALKK